MDAPPRQLTFRDYLVPVVSRRWLVLAIVVVVAGATYAYEARLPLVYSASTKLYVASQGNAIAGIQAGVGSDRQVADEATLVTSTRMAAAVASSTGYKGSPASLRDGVTASPAAGVDVIMVTAHESSAARAALIANSFAQTFINLTGANQQAAARRALAQLQAELRRLPRTSSTSADRQELAAQIASLEVSAATGVTSATHIDPALPPGSPDNRPPWEYALLAGVAALIGGVLLAYMLYRLDFHLQSVEQAIELYRRPIVGTIVNDPGIDAFDQGRPALSKRSKEAFRELRVGLDMSSPDRPIKTLVVTSAGIGEGKSTVARNLALAMSEVGRRVALVDADLRRPALPKKLGVEPENGLTDVIAGKCSLEDVMLSVPVATPATTASEDGLSNNGDGQPEPNGKRPWPRPLTLVPAGTLPPNPPAVIESEAFESLLKAVAERNDIVVIDTTPLTAVTDALPLLARVDGVLIITRSGTTDRRSARHAAEMIGRIPEANAVGIVVNDLPAAEASAYGTSYRYGYGYRYAFRERSNA